MVGKLYYSMRCFRNAEKKAITSSGPGGTYLVMRYAAGIHADTEPALKADATVERAAETTTWSSVVTRLHKESANMTILICR
jgi:hypothetical protein